MGWRGVSDTVRQPNHDKIGLTEIVTATACRAGVLRERCRAKEDQPPHLVQHAGVRLAHADAHESAKCYSFPSSF